MDKDNESLVSTTQEAVSNTANSGLEVAKSAIEGTGEIARAATTAVGDVISASAGALASSISGEQKQPGSRAAGKKAPRKAVRAKQTPRNVGTRSSQKTSKQ